MHIPTEFYYFYTIYSTIYYRYFVDCYELRVIYHREQYGTEDEDTNKVYIQNQEVDQVFEEFLFLVYNMKYNIYVYEA